MIVLAVEKNNRVYGYNDKKEIILNEAGKLHSYTNKTVAIIRQDIIYIYNENGQCKLKYPYDFIDDSNIQGIIM